MELWVSYVGLCFMLLYIMFMYVVPTYKDKQNTQ